MATTTYRSTITADQAIGFSGASYTPDSGGSLSGSSSDTTWPVFWDLNSSTYVVTQAFFGFDLTSPTSGDAISAGSTVNTVTLALYLTEHGSVERVVEVFAYNWSTAVDTGDWRTAAQLTSLYNSGSGLFASYTIPSGWGGAEGAHNFTEGDGAAAAVEAAIGATLRLVIVGQGVRTATAPTGRGYAYFASADHATSTYRPLLTVDWTAGAGGGGKPFCYFAQL